MYMCKDHIIRFKCGEKCVDTFNMTHYRKLLDYYLLNNIKHDYNYVDDDIIGKKIIFNDNRDKERSRYVNKIEKRWFLGYYLILITSQNPKILCNEKTYIWRNINSKDSIVICESKNNQQFVFVT